MGRISSFFLGFPPPRKALLSVGNKEKKLKKENEKNHPPSVPRTDLGAFLNEKKFFVLGFHITERGLLKKIGRDLWIFLFIWFWHRLLDFIVCDAEKKSFYLYGFRI